MAMILMKWGYLHNQKYFLSFFIIHQDLCFAFKIEFVVFVHELIIFLITWLCNY